MNVNRKDELSNPPGFGDRLRRCREALGLTQEAMAELMRVHKQSYYRYEGGRMPSADALIGLAEDRRVSLDWLLAEQGPMLRGEMEESELVWVARKSVELAAGEGAVVLSEEDGEPWPFDPAYFRRTIGLDRNQVVMVDVVGDSMLPTLMPGQPVMVNLSQPQTPVDGIWAVRIAEGVMVKRIQVKPDRTLDVLSDNPHYRPFTIDTTEEQADFALIGRVVWAPQVF